MLMALTLVSAATVDGQIGSQSPDWFYVRSVLPAPPTKTVAATRLEGEVPVIVMEFLSETDGGEYP